MPKVKQFNKEKVLEASSIIFHQKGYNGTSIDEILKATGLSRSSLYDSFGDKHKLYLESLEYYKNATNNGLKAVDKKPLNGIEKIEFVFNEVINHLIKNPHDNGCLMVNAAAEMSKQCDKTAQVVCNNKAEVEDLFNIWIEEAQKENLVTLTKPIKSYGQFLFSTLCGLKVMSQSGATKTELHNVVKVSMDAMN